MRKKELIALYIINKLAKQLRDQLHAFIASMKPLTKGSTGLLPEEAQNELGISEVSYRVGDMEFDSFQDFFNACSTRNTSELGYSYNEPDSILRYILDYFADFNSDDEEKIYDEYGDYAISMDTTLEDLQGLGFTEDGIAIIKKAQSDVRNEIDDVEHAHHLYNCIKEFYTSYKDELRDKIKALYLLKDCVLIKSGAKPVGYHRFAKTKELAAYYNINGFGFHMFVDNSDIIEDIPIREDVIEDLIPSANKLEESIRDEDAVVCLLEYLGVDNAYTQDILNGKTYMLPDDLVAQAVIPNSIYAYKDYEEDYYDDYDEDYESDFADHDEDRDW